MPNTRDIHVSAIIVTWNRRPELEHCLERLSQQIIPDWMQFDILVIDDGSDDNTADFLANCCSKNRSIFAWRLARNHGPGMARNVALTKTQASYILLVDTDAWIETKDGLQQFVKCLESQTDVAVVGGRTWKDTDHKEVFILGGYMTANLHSDLRRWRTEWESPHFVSSCCSLWRREEIVAEGGFDPWYGHGIEDVDVSLRIARRKRMMILPQVDVVHQMTASGRSRNYEDAKSVFRYLEWTRPYLFLKLNGFSGTARAWLHWIIANKEFDRTYGWKLSIRERLLAQWLFPFLQLLLYPFRKCRRNVPLNSVPSAKPLFEQSP